jgi:uncharacterized protein Yka (UPF0111/DUF47 family)
MAISAQIIVKAADALRSAIHAAVRNDSQQAMAFCLEVERFEHDADDQKRVFIGAVLHAKLVAADLLLTYNLAEALESITDRIDTAAELVKRLNVRG